jgi:D-glycero-D-manno-heptose 1,7-bisphosphate phosphatase
VSGPVPGLGAAPARAASRPAVFLDRDGVLDELVDDAESKGGESPLRVDDVALCAEVGSSIARLRERGYVVIGVTNQPAAAKGRVSLADLEAVQARVVDLLASEAAELDGWRWCLHHPAGVTPLLAVACACRKPAPGMLLEAAASFDLDLGRSWIVGDTDADAAAGAAAGCRAVIVTNPASAHKRLDGSRGDLRARDLAAAVELILGDGAIAEPCLRHH